MLTQVRFQNFWEVKISHGLLCRQIMKEMKGKANPASARETLMQEVEKRK